MTFVQRSEQGKRAKSARNFICPTRDQSQNIKSFFAPSSSRLYVRSCGTRARCAPCFIQDTPVPTVPAGHNNNNNKKPTHTVKQPVMPDTLTLIKNRTEPRLGQLERTLAVEGSARPAWVIAILASVLIFTTVVDVLGNLLVIISVFRNRKLRNSGNVFVVSLAFADLVVAFYPYPLVLYALFHDGWALGNTQCMVSGFLMGLSVIGSIFNITGIAVNRYCYICHSFSYSRLYSYRNTLLFVALIWLLTVVAIVPNFFVGSLRYDPRVYSCTFAQNVSSSYTVAVVVVHFLVPIAVVTFCYLRIWVLVIQVRRKVKTEESPRLRPSDLRNFITMFVVFVLFAICWAPLNLIGLAVAIDPSRVAPRIPEWLFVVSYFMAYFNSCLNAIIYGLLNRNFRNEYKRIVTSVWVTRLFVTETSRAATDGRSMRSKQSPPPPLNNNESVRDRANKE